MQATLDQLAQVAIFHPLDRAALEHLQAHSAVRSYDAGETVMQEGDRLPASLYAIAAGTIRITRTATTGKETILRTLTTGEIFAAPALFGNGIAPATVTADSPCQILTVKREALLDTIQATPEVALSMLSVFNQRLQQLHDTVHGLVSERAIARLAHYIHYFANQHGTDPVEAGHQLRSHLPYYQIARSIGITYEECVRLFKQLQPTVTYQRGGIITVTDWTTLDAIASSTPES